MARLVLPINAKLISALGDESKTAEWENAEQELKKLYAVRDNVQKIIEQAEAKVLQNFTKSSDNFQAYTGKYLNISYRGYGAKYKLSDEAQASDEMRAVLQDGGFYKQETKQVETTTIDTKAVDAYIHDHSQLPVGIENRERKKLLKVEVKTEEE